jgi:McrBC 5-methylcytosine restriction system component
MLSIACVEGEPFRVEANLRDMVRAAGARLVTQLRPRFRILSEDAGAFTVSGVIGTISLGPGLLLDVVPKTGPAEDWVHSVLSLLIGTDRIDAAGERAAGLSQQRRDLLEILAAIYAARLRRALGRDGPIVLISRQQAELQRLKGKLRVTPWLRRAVWQPHRMPVAFDHLTADHDFARGLAFVARLLARSTSSPITRGALVEAARSLRPGHSEDVMVASSVATRSLPPQWSSFEPAWSIAAAILSQRSLLGPTGRYHGISIVIEAWPLLERLLQRALSAAVRLALKDGKQLGSPTKFGATLLDQPRGSASASRRVEPDGRLELGGRTIATFEAKYQRRVDQEWPYRGDIFQALATAAACGSPVAVLVYPETFPTAWWRVRGFDDHPAHLAAIGLGLFSYRGQRNDDALGRRVLDLLIGPQQLVEIVA